MLLALYLYMGGPVLFVLGYFMGRIRPMKRLGFRFAIQRDND